MANKYRNEVAFKVGDRDFKLRPSLEVLEEFERVHMDEVNEVMASITGNHKDVENKLKTAKVTALYKCVGFLIHCADKETAEKEAAEFAYNNLSYVECFMIVAEFNANAYYGGGETPKGKPKGTPKKS